MIRPFVSQVSQFRVTWLAIGLLVGAMLVATAVTVVAPRLGTLGGAEDAATQRHPGYGVGYPQHGGLAGPSTPRVQQYPGYGVGYPQHGGLAGPSLVTGVQQHPGYGIGYPMHGGLAGPSTAGSQP